MRTKEIGFLVVVFALMVFSACSKVEDEVIIHPEDPNSTYYPMSIGSYWIYDEYVYDSIQPKPTGKTDSTYIASDTTIDGKKYFVYRSSSSPLWSLVMRDSSGYLVDNYGVIYFNSKAIGDTIFKKGNFNQTGDTIYFQYRVMYKVGYVVDVPAGHFTKVKDARYTQYFPKAISTPKRRISFNYYAKDVGLIYRTYLSFGKNYEVRLARYHIEP